MKIYIGHSSSIDFEGNLYEPIRGSELDVEHDIVMPHEDSDEIFDSKQFLREECDIFIAEVSEASTGLGIELGWADIYNVPIICIHRKDRKISSSLDVVADRIEGYGEPGELPSLILEQIERMRK